jgi:hypothetical protein
MIMAVTLTIRELEKRLGKAFTPEQTTVLVEALDAIRQAELQRAADTDDLKRGLATLTAAQTHTEATLARLDEAITRLAEVQARSEQTMIKWQETLGEVRGSQFEMRYRHRASAYFGPLLRRLKVLAPNEIEAVMEANLEAQLSQEELEDFLRVDLLLTGRPRNRPDSSEVWLAVEVSAVVDRHDVVRAQRRAAAIRRAGYLAIPTVAGAKATAEAEAIARAEGVLLVQNGVRQFWNEALAMATTS